MPNKQKEKLVINWQTVFKVAIILFIITAVSALLLAVTNHFTAGPIAEQKEATNIAARKTVLPDAEEFNAVEDFDAVAPKAYPDDPALLKEAFAGTKNGKIVGYTVKVSPKGYGGEIEMIVGISSKGKVTAIEIISLSETAGLGAKADTPAFKGRFQGLDAGRDIVLKKDGSSDENGIDAITGATITSTAVTKGVNAACGVYRVLNEAGLKKGGK